MLNVIATLKGILSHIETRQWLAYIGVAFTLALSEGLGFLILIPLLTTGANYSTQIFPSLLENTSDRVLTVLLVFFILFTLRSLLAWIQKQMSFDLEVSIVDPLRLKLLSAIQDTEWESLSQRKNGDFLDLFNTTLVRFAGAVQILLALCVALLTLGVYISLLAWISPSMSAAAMALLSPLFLLTVWKNKRILALGYDITDHSKTLQHRLHESLGTLRISRRQPLKDWHREMMEKAQNTMRGGQQSFVHIQGNLQLLFQLLGTSLLCGYLYVALVVVKVPLTELSLLVLGFARLYPLVTRIQQMIQSLKFVAPAVETLTQELQWLHTHREHLEQLNTATPHPFPEIVLNNIVLSYQRKEGSYRLQIDSIKIPSGSLCCIVGPSGEGKSTLLDLLGGVIRQKTGQLHLVNQPQQDTNRFKLREYSRYVSQDNQLIHGTIRDNLLIGNPTVDDESLRQCLERVNGDFVFELSKQLDTPVGERGQQLSGGQKQRILLANALLANPALLILDEATSALDRQSEEKIHHTLQRLKGYCTIVMVSHRISSLYLADILVAVKDGTAAVCNLEQARSFCV